MKIALPFALILAAVSGRASAAEPVLSATGYGVIKFGSRLSAVERKLAERAPPPADKDEAACRFIRFKAYPEAQFMIENGIVTRADVTERAKNDLHILVGARLEKVKAEHPSVHIEPHHYDPSGHYLVFKSTDGKFAIVMEEGDGKITDIRGGIEPSVEYVEGCQ